MAKILVVDDDKTSTALFRQALTMYNYDVIIVNESIRVMDIAMQERPDLIILDLMMPEPDGFRVCRMLRADAILRKTPIIIVTALNDVDSRLVAIGAGANDYLVKPFHIDTLFNSVERLISKPLQTGDLKQNRDLSQS